MLAVNVTVWGRFSLKVAVVFPKSPDYTGYETEAYFGTRKSHICRLME